MLVLGYRDYFMVGEVVVLQFLSRVVQDCQTGKFVMHTKDIPRENLGSQFLLY